MASPPGRASWKQEAQTFTLTPRNVLLFRSAEVECCKHENKYLIALSEQKKNSLQEYQYQMCVRLQVHARQRGWFKTCSTSEFSVSFQGKVLWLLPDNNYQWPPVTRLLSLFTQLQLWENDKSISYSWTDICSVWEEKPPEPISSTHSIHSESLCVLAVWINPVFSLPSGWKE